ncbi:Acyl dehydratase [Candidatus Rhodobacter oscarellae]|uniref:Acyl dehydratase n=1 Tax=Candidatus Rhodobacter oscarellae TaxID=1675527 RepID=A0A0J9GXB5_9RHOB|nr:MaoC family dehydratase [Candidatus Rhodobacter lobularis]KMW58133.1 Acyl dehydratase [Candidatus Rhodobacter lobularis]
MSPEELREKLGEPFGTSRWYEIGQDRIDAFAEVTEDRQYIHLDPVRAAQTPFGGTVAHGFLTLGMLSAMSYDVIPLTDAPGVNYGFNRLRFVAPVRAGARLRAHFTLKALQEAADHVALTWGVEVEIEGAAKPALVAEWLTRRYFEQHGEH